MKIKFFLILFFSFTLFVIDSNLHLIKANLQNSNRSTIFITYPWNNYIEEQSSNFNMKVSSYEQAGSNSFSEPHYSKYEILQKYLAVQNNLRMNPSDLNEIRHLSQEDLIKYLKWKIEVSQTKEDFNVYVFKHHNLYCCSNFLELIRNLSGYENYIKKTLQKYYSDKKFKHLVDQLDSIDGHENNYNDKGLIQKAVSFFKKNIAGKKCKKAFRDFLQDEIERLERLKRNNQNLNISKISQNNFNESFCYSNDDPELINRFKKRKEALSSSLNQKEQYFDYSNQVKNYKFTDSNAEFFNYCYGSMMDKQLHEELCEIRQSAMNLQTQYHDENVEAFSGMILHFTALAKVQPSANVAFHLSDFSHYLLKAGEILVGGTALGLKKSINPIIHPIDDFLKPLGSAGIALGMAVFELVNNALEDPTGITNPIYVIQKATNLSSSLFNYIKENPQEGIATIVELLVPVGLSKFAKLKQVSSAVQKFKKITQASEYFEIASNVIKSVANPIKTVLRETAETLKIGLEHGKDALRNVIKVIKGEPELVTVGDLAALSSPEHFKDVQKLTEVAKEIKINNNVINKSKLLQELNELKSNKINHIINGSKTSNHKWEKLFPDKNWSKIKNIIIEVLETGQEEIYKSGASKVKMINDKLVQVTYKKLLDGTIKIGNAWIK